MKEDIEKWAAWVETMLAGQNLTPVQKLAVVLALTLGGAKLPDVAPTWIARRR